MNDKAPLMDDLISWIAARDEGDEFVIGDLSAWAECSWNHAKTATSKCIDAKIIALKAPRLSRKAAIYVRL